MFLKHGKLKELVLKYSFIHFPYICFLPVQMSAEKETKESDRLFASVIRSVEERRAEVNAEITEKQKAAERRSEELINELQQEISELQRRNTELEELTNSEDHLRLLQVNLKLWFFNFQQGFWSNF